jgi:hypothetical protein
MSSIIAEQAEPARPAGSLVSRRALLSCAAAAVASPLSAWSAVGPDKGASGAAAPTRIFPLPVRSSYVGVNLAPVRYWTTQFPFADMMKNGNDWSSGDDKGARNAGLSLRPDGYPAALHPGQQALTAVAWSRTRYPVGRYTVLWDGKGSVGLPPGRVAVRSAEAQRLVVDVADNSGPLQVTISATEAADPVRNVRVLWPGTEATHAAQPFNPAFLEKLAPFSLLRFMDWGGTNGSPLVEWADRPQTSDLTYSTAKGVPVEVMVDLANALRADPWFCVPHQASDDYIRQFASLLHARLDPALRPRIEYSNEVWNLAFAQNQWAAAQSERLGLPRPSGMPSAFYALRSVAIFRIFAEVYGADRGRLVRVIAGQASWTPFQESALAWQDTAAHADVLAVAPYFKAEAAGDPKNVEATLARTSEQLLDDMLVHIRGKVAASIRTNATLARKYGLKLEGYEGGTHDTSTQFPPAHQEAMSALFAAAHRHPRMREVYAEYFALWIASGGDLLAHYNAISAWSKYGLWGSLEYVMQEASEAPKYQALLDVIARHPRPTS